VRDSIRLPGTSSPIQDVGPVAEGQVLVREPVQSLDASPKVIVSQGVGAVQDFSLGPAHDLTLDQWGPPQPTLVLRREISDPTLGVRGERQHPTLADTSVRDPTLVSPWCDIPRYIVAVQNTVPQVWRVSSIPCSSYHLAFSDVNTFASL